MADISRITLPSGTTYNIKDAVARQQLGSTIAIRGTTTTPLTDEATTNPIVIEGAEFTAHANDAVFYQKAEFVFDGTHWHEFGDMSGLGALAQKDTASANYTPAGAISHPTFTGENLTSTGEYTPSGAVVISDNEDGNYQPEGTITTPQISVKTAGATATVNSITNVGTLPSLTTTVENENLTISFNSGALPTKGADVSVKTSDAEYEATTPVFTGAKVQLNFEGTQANLSVSGTPVGDVSTPVFTGTPATITVS